MKKLKHLFTLVAIAGALTGCATQDSEVALSKPPKNTVDDRNTYSIAVFQDANRELYKKDYPDAAVVVRSAIESAFVKYGKHLVKDKGDIEITGIVTTYHRGEFWAGYERGYTTVGISLKATDSKSGRVLWTASVMKRTQLIYDYDPAKFSQEVADAFVKAIVAKTEKP